MSKEDGRGVNSRGVWSPKLEEIDNLVDRMDENITTEELEKLADIIDEGNELYLMDTLRKKVVGKDPSRGLVYNVPEVGKCDVQQDS